MIKKLKVEPKRRKCVMCKKRRVIGHHFYCNKCWKIRHLNPKKIEYGRSNQ